jgi:amidophosphoribosyltransferase
MDGVRSVNPWANTGQPHAFCIFEYVYFARPDSDLYNKNVAQVRINIGRELARQVPVTADLVIPVPDSGNWAAMGFAEESGIPFGNAFVRNHYVGRTFLQPSQLIRDFGVRVKLNLIKEMVAGKRVVVVDDSIVRGTTARARVITLREAGAKEVHMRVSSPPITGPCCWMRSEKWRPCCRRSCYACCRSGKWTGSAVENRCASMCVSSPRRIATCS